MLKGTLWRVSILETTAFSFVGALTARAASAIFRKIGSFITSRPRDQVAGADDDSFDRQLCFAVLPLCACIVEARFEELRRDRIKTLFYEKGCYDRLKYLLSGDYLALINPLAVSACWLSLRIIRLDYLCSLLQERL